MSTYKQQQYQNYQKPPFTPAVTTVPPGGSSSSSSSSTGATSSNTSGGVRTANNTNNSGGSGVAPSNQQQNATGSAGSVQGGLSYAPQIATILTHQPPPQTPQQQQGQVGAGSQQRVPPPPPPHHHPTHPNQQQQAGTASQPQASSSSSGSSSAQIATSAQQQQQQQQQQTTSNPPPPLPQSQPPFNQPPPFMYDYYSGGRGQPSHPQPPPPPHQTANHHNHPSHPGMMHTAAHLGNPAGGPHHPGAPNPVSHQPQSQVYILPYMQPFNTPMTTLAVGQPHHQPSVVGPPHTHPFDVHHFPGQPFYSQQSWMSQQQAGGPGQQPNAPMGSQMPMNAQAPSNMSNVQRAANDHHQQPQQILMHQQASGAGGSYQQGHPGHHMQIQPTGYHPSFVTSQTATPQSSQAHLQQGQNAQQYVTGIYMSNLPPNVLLAPAQPQPQQPQVQPPTSQQAQHAQPQAQSQQQQSQQSVVQQQQPQPQQPQSQQPVMGALNPAAQQILAAQMLQQQQQPSQPLQKRERKPLLIVNPATKEPVKLDNISSTTPSSQTNTAHAPTSTVSTTTSSSSAPATNTAAASTDAQKNASATAQKSPEAATTVTKSSTTSSATAPATTTTTNATVTAATAVAPAATPVTATTTTAATSVPAQKTSTGAAGASSSKGAMGVEFQQAVLRNIHQNKTATPNTTTTTTTTTPNDQPANKAKTDNNNSTTTPAVTTTVPTTITPTTTTTTTTTTTNTPAPVNTTTPAQPQSRPANDSNNNTTISNNNTNKTATPVAAAAASAAAPMPAPVAGAPAAPLSYAAKLAASKAQTQAQPRPQAQPATKPTTKTAAVSVAQAPVHSDTKSVSVSVAAAVAQTTSVVASTPVETTKVESKPSETDKKPIEPVVAQQPPTTVVPPVQTPNVPKVEVTEPPAKKEEPPKQSEKIPETKPATTTPTPTTPAPEKPQVVEAVSSSVVTPVPSSQPVVVAAAPTSTLPFWNPLNTSAKKRYDREFLLSLKDKPASKQVPDELKASEIMLDLSAIQQSHYNKSSSTRSMSGMGDRGSSDGQNLYSKGGSMTKKNSKYGGSMNKYAGRGSIDAGGGRGGSSGGGGGVVIQIDHNLELNRVENPYQVRRNLDENEALLRDVRTILNKLTPQNLQKLTGDLINLAINTQERLEGAIDIIFEKSIDEQVFSTTYAQLCKVLSSIKVPSTAEPGKLIQFRTMLLTKCQREFDSDYSQNINYEKLLAEAETHPDETKRRELREIAEDKLSRAKRRSLGNIRFIGELFKLQMLTEGIMNDCMERLLKQESDEENLECLCKLMTTIGKELDKTTNAHKMKIYFDKLAKIATKKDAVSARIRFMIMDVIDLRKNGWVPRRKDAAPRRIEDIRKEAEEEQARQEAEYAKNAAENKQRMTGMSGAKGSQSKGYQQQHSGSGQIGKSTSMDSEGFSTRPNKAQNGSMAKSIKEVKSITNKNINGELTLGPGGGGFSWATKSKPATTDSSAASAASASSASSSSTLPASASFSAAQYSSSSGSRQANETESGTPHERRTSSSSSSSSASQQRSRPSQLYEKETSGGQQNVTARLSMDQNRYGGANRQIQNVKRIDSASSLTNTGSQASSQASSRDSSQTRPGSANPNASHHSSSAAGSSTITTANSRAYTEDEIERKAINMIEEYATNKNIGDALKDLEEFQPIDAAQKCAFMEKLFMVVLDRNECIRSALGTILQQALLADKLDMPAFTEGLKRVFEQVEDMAIDVPKIGTYLAQSIAPIFTERLSVEFLKNACEPILESKMCGELISDILHQASNRLGHNTVATIFHQSNLKLSYFLRAYDSNPGGQADFIKSKNLGFCVGGQRERTQSASISSDSYEKRLNEMLSDKQEENESIFDKIENEFGSVDCQTKPFIRALVISVCLSCLSDNKIDPEMFKKRAPILNKFIDKREEFELESLYAIQALDYRTKHQPNFIRVLFDLLYDEDIIPEDVFKKWKEEGREDGHAISALSLKAFFEWLNEADTDQ